jgi:hypothetical protein
MKAAIDAAAGTTLFVVAAGNAGSDNDCSVDVLPPLGGKVVSAGRLNAHKALLALAPASALPQLPRAPEPQPRSPLESACIVPHLRGRTVGQARRLVKGTRCTLGTATPKFSKRIRKGRIISQTRPPAARFLLGTRVDVFVSRGRRPLQKHPRLREVRHAARPIA